MAHAERERTKTLSLFLRFPLPSFCDSLEAEKFSFFLSVSYLLKNCADSTSRVQRFYNLFPPLGASVFVAMEHNCKLCS